MGLRLGIALVALACGGCGIDESGLAPLDGAPPPVDAQTDAQNPVDAAPPPADGSTLDVAPPPVEAGPCDDDANDCTSPEVPAGWTPVAYAENATAACPAPFAAQEDVVTNVTNGTASCACTCSETSAPDCTTGTIATYYSSNSSCGSQGLSLTFTNGGCTTVGGNLANYYASTAIAPQGGSCAVQTTSSGSPSTTPARLCTPDSSCSAAACAGYAPPGFVACIVADGNQSCPSGSSFTKKHAVAASVTATCTNTCGTSCALQGSCKSPQVHFFSDTQCNNQVATFPSDTTCTSTGGAGYVAKATYTATYSYTGCTTAGTSTVQLDPTTPRTVCCR